VIDPGHGGHDTGTIGPTGLEEKDLVLDVGRRLGKLLQTRLARKSSTRARTIHSFRSRLEPRLQTKSPLICLYPCTLTQATIPTREEWETYYLNFTSSPEALEVAARENAVSEKSIHELQDLVKKIALKERLKSRRSSRRRTAIFAHRLGSEESGQRDRGVKKAPFIVLIGANMPSILAEISFLSNPGDEHRLETADYRQKIAESLYRGIAKYVGGLSGVKVASRIDKSEDSSATFSAGYAPIQKPGVILKDDIALIAGRGLGSFSEPFRAIRVAQIDFHRLDLIRLRMHNHGIIANGKIANLSLHQISFSATAFRAEGGVSHPLLCPPTHKA